MEFEHRSNNLNQLEGWLARYKAISEPPSKNGVLYPLFLVFLREDKPTQMVNSVRALQTNEDVVMTIDYLWNNQKELVEEILKLITFIDVTYPQLVLSGNIRLDLLELAQKGLDIKLAEAHEIVGQLDYGNSVLEAFDQM